MKPPTIQAETNESLEVTLRASIDPTADVVAFAFTPRGARPQTWTAGTWLPGWTHRLATAVTPMLGGPGSGADVILPLGMSHMFMRVTDNPETPVLAAGCVIVDG